MTAFWIRCTEHCFTPLLFAPSARNDAYSGNHLVIEGVFKSAFVVENEPEADEGGRAFERWMPLAPVKQVAGITIALTFQEDVDPTFEYLKTFRLVEI